MLTDKATFPSFIAEKTGHGLAEFFQDNKFTLNRIESLREADYFVYLGISDLHKKRLGLSSDEILVCVLHYKKQQQWFLTEIRDKLKYLDRISKTAVLVISADPNIEKLCRSAFADQNTGYKTAHIAIHLEAIDECKTKIQREAMLLRAFDSQSFIIDHFDTRNPVPDDLFGRQTLASQIEADVRSLPVGVAILGIRRVGKTSILRRVISQLRNDPDHGGVVGYYDAQADNVDANAFTATAGLLSSLTESAQKFGIELPSKPDKANSIAHLKKTVEFLVKMNTNVILAVDEIEWLIPININSNQPESQKSYLRLFGLLRSIKQDYESHVRLIICGINETFCELPRIGEHENPVLDWFKPHYISLLNRTDTCNMLIELGNRMGLSLSPEFLERVWDAFGGHAYLARQFCSEVAKHNPNRPRTLMAKEFTERYQQFLHRSGNVFESILKHLVNFYPNEYRILRAIAQEGGIDTSLHNGINHLLAYGLVVAQKGQYCIIQEALSYYVAQHSAEEVSQERYNLLERTGSGATGTVWRAWDHKGRRMCALKIYDINSGIDQNLIDVEYKILKTLEGVYTPKVYNTCQIDDRSAICMEFVEGRTLASILKERYKLYGEEISKFAKNLFEAMKFLHSQKSQLDKYEKLNSSMVEGYLHRDLKPQNIIIRDEKEWTICLVDLQLAKPINSMGITKVGTPAYLPPDWGKVPWDVSFDLYSLGCILFEIIYGKNPSLGEFDGDISISLQDPDERRVVIDFFSKVLHINADSRYRSISAMMTDWEYVAVIVAQ